MVGVPLIRGSLGIFIQEYALRQGVAQREHQRGA